MTKIWEMLLEQSFMLTTCGITKLYKEIWVVEQNINNKEKKVKTQHEYKIKSCHKIIVQISFF